MRKLLPIVMLLLPLVVVAAPTLKPEHAAYSVLRDGKAIGEASYTLSANPDGSFVLRSETRGSAGMAKLLGLDVREESVFNVHDRTLQGLRYDYRQDAAIKHKQRHMDFDWPAGLVRVRDNGKNFQYAVVPGCIDRSAVAVALGLAVADGAKAITLPVAVRDRVEQQHYAVRGEEKIQLAQGSFITIVVERTDTKGKAKSWYAPSLGVLPVRVQQQQRDGSVILMERK